MTKKEFKEKTHSHVYSGNRTKTNVLFFDWQETNNGRGFKYGVASDVDNCCKKDLFNHLFDWVVNNIEPPYFVRYKYAMTDRQRFKTPLSLNF